MQLVVAVLAREPPDPLHQREQLGALVPGERLAEQLTELADRGPQGGVLLSEDTPPAYWATSGTRRSASTSSSAVGSITVTSACGAPLCCVMGDSLTAECDSPVARP